jgi:penicillin amidase
MNAPALAARIVRIAALVCAVAVLAAAAGALWLRHRISASLPALDGSFTLRGLSAPVRVSRDSLGVPTVEGQTREDVARATGWLHAQDRFFQMDLLRRRGAGELSELFGKAALGADREARMHRFRQVARESLAREGAGRRALLDAYAQGVNQGLAALRSKPWEYAVLRAEPRPWQAEDTVLIFFAMTLDLQDPTARFGRTLAIIRDELGPASLAFFAPLGTPGDAALDGSAMAAAPVPPAAEIDLRKRNAGGGAGFASAGPWEGVDQPGSNNFAVSGALTASGAALVSNDMHLHLGIPNIWYRMSLRWPGHQETGVTLPGAPAIVAGSTGKIAWGFTNSNAATGDIIVVDASASPELYHGPKGTGLVPYDNRTESVVVKGSAPERMVFPWTVWGPVIGNGTEGHMLAFHWTEDDPAATNLNIIELEDAADTPAAIAIAHRMGIPAQNFIVGDSSGVIGWTVAGKIPKRVGYDGRLPAYWSFGDRRWDGYLGPDEIPTVVSPKEGFLWTANNRTVGGSALAALGDSGYDIAARARQIRDDLAALSGARRPLSPKDLLGVQLDDRALMLEGWHASLLSALTPAAVAAKPSRASLLDASRTWEGRADAGSASYRIVRAFRLAVAHRVFDPIFAPCVADYEDFTWTRLNYEQPLEAILRERPPHLLDPSYRTWDDLLVAAADDVSEGLRKAGLSPSGARWGLRNTARIEHPFSRFLPRWASSWLAMPADELPGDSNMPRVQDPSFGASERFDVAPGHEAEGIFHMPGGQCGNPLSPYFQAGHEDWVRGNPSPFLPGAAVHALSLVP